MNSKALDEAELKPPLNFFCMIVHFILINKDNKDF